MKININLMRKSPAEIEVNPDVLRWARESSGWSVDELAEKLSVDKQIIEGWEKKPSKIKIGTLKKISSYFKRSFEVFLLPSPPKERPLPKDFRLLSSQSERLSKESLFAIRKARRLQDIANDLLTNVKQEKSIKLRGVSIDENPETVAEKERDNFNIKLEDQSKWKNPHEAYRHWRTSIENKNILVFQTPISEDVRGFSLADGNPAIIVINSSDAVNARIFTLFHEYAHLLLRTPGICDPTTNTMKLYQLYKTEKWCNQFAASFLMPHNDLQFLFRDIPRLEETNLLNYISKVSTRLKISREVVLIRLFNLGRVSKEDYVNNIDKIRQKKKELNKGEIIINPAVKCLSEKGNSFVSLVLQNKSKDFITYNDALDYLSVKTKALEKIQSRFKR